MDKDVYIADWDEANAFCNIPRESCGALLGEAAPGLGDWLHRFYDSLMVYVMTPFGPTDAYPLLHGGAQGDSMGVGTHEAVGIRRTEFHLGVLRGGLSPEDLAGGGPSLANTCLFAPFHRAGPGKCTLPF